MKTKRFFAAILTCILAISFCACGKSTGTAGSGEVDSDVESGTYPIKTDKTLTMYIPLESNAAQSVKNLGETAFAKELEKQTGVKIKYMHPSNGSSESFNLMLASDELPDIICHYWPDFPGGAAKAVKDGYIIDTTDLVEKYAPNYKKILEEHPDWKKYVMTDDNRMFGFPAITEVQSTGGLIIRQDWLDELNLEMPETIDEWENVLTAFRDKKGAKAPLSMDTSGFRTGAFTGAYNIQLDWYADGDELKYGYYEDSYRDFLAKMNEWYDKGLFDNNFSTSDSKMFTANILNGKSGATYGGITSGIAKFNSANEETDPNYKVVAAPFPASKKGETPEFGQYSPNVSVFYTAISTSCKYPELAARVIDFYYSKAGQDIFNYGVEGESYTMQDGKPVFTDKILNPTGDDTTGKVLSYYAKPYNTYASITLLDAYEQTLKTDEMKNALEVWGNTNQKKRLFPSLYPTSDEQSELANIQNAIDTYVREMLIKFVMGVEPLSSFDDYRANLKQMGIERLIELKNAAYKRAMNR